MKTDSPTAAKAREQRISEIAEREKKATNSPHLSVYEHGGGRMFSGNDLIADFYDEENREFYYHSRGDIPFLLAELAATEKRVREECAKAVCKSCADGVPLRHVSWHWTHEVPGIGIGPCHAAAIRSLELKPNAV